MRKITLHNEGYVKFANYQTFIWKNALETDQEIPEADHHGCSGIDKTYKVWMDNQNADDEILELVVCDFKKGKCTEQCQWSSRLVFISGEELE